MKGPPSRALSWNVGSPGGSVGPQASSAITGMETLPEPPFMILGGPFVVQGPNMGWKEGSTEMHPPTSQGRQKGVLRPSPEPGGRGCLGGAWLGACLGSFQGGGCLRKVLRISGSWDTPKPHTALGDKTLIDCLSPLNKTLGNSC